MFVCFFVQRGSAVGSVAVHSSIILRCSKSSSGRKRFTTTLNWGLKNTSHSKILQLTALLLAVGFGLRLFAMWSGHTVMQPLRAHHDQSLHRQVSIINVSTNFVTHVGNSLCGTVGGGFIIFFIYFLMTSFFLHSQEKTESIACIMSTGDSFLAYSWLIYCRIIHIH